MRTLNAIPKKENKINEKGMALVGERPLENLCEVLLYSDHFTF
jgi:hypothetical protein